MSSYDTSLDKNKANHVPLSPLTFLERAKDVYPNYEAVVYEDRKYTWSEVYKRSVKFASALSKIGISKGDTVSFLAFNTPEIFEAHYSVPMTGGVLNTINVRLDANTIAYILDHSEAKVLVVDRQLHAEVKKALKILDKKVKLFITYPASTGRNFVEVLRVIDSLQLTANYSVATPANWKDGEDVIVVPAIKTEDALVKFPKGLNIVKPYLRYTPQPNK